MDINKMRKEYCLERLELKSLKKDPFLQFSEWFQKAVEVAIQEPNAMVLSTASKEGRPSARTVLMKEIDQRGLIFYTNYDSRKAHDIDENPFAALTFLWKEVEKQVRVYGRVEKVSRGDSEDYFASRPRGSQISTWASPQGTVIPSREYLEERYREVELEYKGKEIPLPAFWGGFRLIPEEFIFWQGRENRLHDQFRYTKNSDGTWNIDRLAP
jgi:pyridoxamine 5'-phosphate oxidase